MKCTNCSKDKLFLHLIGKDSICAKCIVKHTVFKEVAESSEARLRKALRVFDVRSFEELKKVKDYSYEELKKMKPKRQNTVKYKKKKKDDDGLFLI
ncbi:hypothetical protein GF327_00650 [Candidatus Woesearchaeota archaeon]|nr:hypothetical protein [Candidatus Woesearchaeota archaeon]